MATASPESKHPERNKNRGGSKRKVAESPSGAGLEWRKIDDATTSSENATSSVSKLLERGSHSRSAVIDRNGTADGANSPKSERKREDLPSGSTPRKRKGMTKSLLAMSTTAPEGVAADASSLRDASQASCERAIVRTTFGSPLPERSNLEISPETMPRKRRKQVAL